MKEYKNTNTEYKNIEDKTQECGSV